MSTYVVFTSQGPKIGKVIKQGPRVTKILAGDEVVSVRTKEIDTPLCRYVRTLNSLLAEYKSAAANYKIFNCVRDRDTFFKFSLANWTASERPNRQPDHVSESGSKYWYTQEGVYRESDHWSFCVASCNWALDDYYICDGVERCGFCRWEDFQVNPLYNHMIEETKTAFEKLSKYIAQLEPQLEVIEASTCN